MLAALGWNNQETILWFESSLLAENFQARSRQPLSPQPYATAMKELFK